MPDLGTASRFRRRGRADSTTFALALLALALPVASLAQTAPPTPAPLPLAVPPLAVQGPWDSTIRLELFDRLRGEFVDWFEPKEGAPNPTNRYDFVGNKFQLGVRVNRDPYELFVQYQDSSLGGLPDDGVGVGSIYYANTNRTTQNGTILRNAWLGTTRLFGVGGLSLRGGRQLYSDGMEAKPRSATLKWVQQYRIGQRLVGPFEYTHVGRSFDGGMLAYGTERGNATGFFFRPTFGGFDVNANRELNINVAGASLNLNESPDASSPLLENTIARMFWLYYDDQRDVVFLDNRPLPERQADRGKPAVLHTVGASAARVERLGAGNADALVYGMGQLGEWQSLQQNAWAYGVEGGYRLTEVWSAPWMRVGINSASGDTDPSDGEHQTFFQMLPTAWLYAQFPFYNMMNNQDVFAQWILDPHPMLSYRLDFHWLRLNTGNDLAYFGGGATKNDFFGFGGTPANQRNELAYLVHFMLTVRPTAFLSFNAFYGHAWGQGVVAQTFAGTDGNYGFLEALLSF